MSTTSNLYCLECGAANPLHAHFCRLCGKTLPQDNQAVDVDVAVSQGPSALGGLLKQRYRIEALLGSGGFGQVYKAADTEFGGRLVAIKEMSQDGLQPQDVLAATEVFKREAFLLAALTHPNLPSIYDYFTENGRWYLVMSFIEGETLEDYLARARSGRLPVEKVLHFGIQLASVLSYLHTRHPPIIFRDLKPTNVMRTPEGMLYLIDFGIARHFKQGQARDTMVLGSPGYAAPEQYGRSQTTPQTDVYSMGSLLHQLLSGHDPSLTPFLYVPLNLPDYPELSHLISCMLEHDAKKRPASMANIKRELQRIENGNSRILAHRRPPRQPYPPSASAPPIPPLPRHLPMVQYQPAQPYYRAHVTQQLLWQPQVASRRVLLAGKEMLVTVGGFTVSVFEGIGNLTQKAVTKLSKPPSRLDDES